MAIRAACAALGDFSLAGCVLYTSCEPCPLCVAACLWARLDRVAYAADRHDAARGGFDDHEFYELFDRDRSTWADPGAAGRPRGLVRAVRRLAEQGRPDRLLRLAEEFQACQTARAAARPAVRPENRQPPRKVPSRAL